MGKEQVKKYYLIYKPYQVLSQFSPKDGKKCLSDYFRFDRDVYSVGRLDYDSEGLMLLTNDNYLKTAVLDPDQKQTKEYLVQVEGDIDESALYSLRKGVTIKLDDGPYTTKPCKAEKLKSEPWLPERNPPIRFRENQPTSWIRITITEGKNRQIRKMAANVGFPALRIVRVAIGEIGLGGLKPGDSKQLREDYVYSQLNIRSQQKYRY